MEHLDFILWMLLFPVTMSLQEYISAKKREITKEKPKEFSEETNSNAELLAIFIWFFVGWLVF
jgi:hypothetical protein